MKPALSVILIVVSLGLGIIKTQELRKSLNALRMLYQWFICLNSVLKDGVESLGAFTQRTAHNRYGTELKFIIKANELIELNRSIDSAFITAFENSSIRKALSSETVSDIDDLFSALDGSPESLVQTLSDKTIQSIGMELEERKRKAAEKTKLTISLYVLCSCAVAILLM